MSRVSRIAALVAVMVAVPVGFAIAHPGEEPGQHQEPGLSVEEQAELARHAEDIISNCRELQAQAEQSGQELSPACVTVLNDGVLGTRTVDVPEAGR